MKPRVGLLTTHPIQYQAPLFREVTRQGGMDLTVFFCHAPTPDQRGVGFGVPVDWDVDLTSGYEHRWLTNVSHQPGVAKFGGCDTPEVATLIRRSRFDAFVVMGWGFKSYWQAMLACWRSGTPVILRGDSQLDPRQAGHLKLLKRLLYPAFIRRAAVCMPYGIRSEAYFRAYGARRIVVAPHFVDNEWFARESDEARRRHPRQQVGVPESSCVFLFAGKLQEKKRPGDLIRALGQVRDVDATALIVGEGPLRAECEQLAGDLQVPVRFEGFVNQSRMPAMYAASDALVLPSDGETWGLVVNEAMASGIPVAVSDAVGCVPDLIVPGETGYSYTTGRVGELSGCLRRLATDRENTARLSLRARHHISGYSAIRAADALLAAAGPVPSWGASRGRAS